MKWICTALFVLFAASSVRAEEFQVGQVWRYETRPQEGGSLLTIVKIDEIGGARIIHVSLAGLKLKTSVAGGGYVDELGHLPISDQALAKSVTDLVRTSRALPDFEEGYRQWKGAFDRGEAGFFTLTVAECVSAIERALNAQD